VSEQASPTDKSQALREAVYRDAHREVDRVVYREVDQYSMKATYRERNREVDWKVTKSTFRISLSRTIYESMPITDDYRLQAIFYGALHKGSGERKCT